MAIMIASWKGEKEKERNVSSLETSLINKEEEVFAKRKIRHKKERHKKERHRKVMDIKENGKEDRKKGKGDKEKE